VVTDGSAVLGLGNIGPAAALPVMEGKAALFKRFADIDAWPLCLDTQDTDEIIAVVKAVAPGFARDQPGRHLRAEVLRDRVPAT
jgi:malate dehydrogenase (oxaloacetate-decarboxylating)